MKIIKKLGLGISSAMLVCISSIAMAVVPYNDYYKNGDDEKAKVEHDQFKDASEATDKKPMLLTHDHEADKPMSESKEGDADEKPKDAGHDEKPKDAVAEEKHGDEAKDVVAEEKHGSESKDVVAKEKHVDGVHGEKPKDAVKKDLDEADGDKSKGSVAKEQPHKNKGDVKLSY